MDKLLIEQMLKKVESKIQQKEALIGFDGFIDHIVKPIFKNDTKACTYFETAQQFSNYISEVDHKSMSIELEEQLVKIGGNNPILSKGMSQLGLRVHSIGAYGKGSVGSIFKELEHMCTLYPIAEPGCCTAYEFINNKLITFTNIREEELNYNTILRYIGKEKLLQIVDRCELLAWVNFGEMPWIRDIWEKMLTEVLPYSHLEMRERRKIFFDLSDCSRIEDETIEEVMATICRYSNFGKVYLTMNTNEFEKVYGSIVKKDVGKLQEVLSRGDLYTEEIKAYVKGLKDKLSLECIILRSLQVLVGARDEETVSIENWITDQPKVLTGAGDNQNVGICAGILSDLSLEESLQLGVVTGRYYIETGESASIDKLRSYIGSSN